MCLYSSIITDFITSASEQTLDRIRWFMQLEVRPRTLNEPYYCDYRNRFLGHYKGWRPKDSQARSSLTQRINDAIIDTGDEPELLGCINDVLSGLTRMGLHGTQATDLAKLLPPDPQDAGIEIMASARAYFQGELRSDRAYVQKQG